MSCQSCGTIEGFTNSAFSPAAPVKADGTITGFTASLSGSQAAVASYQTATAGYQTATAPASAFQPFMKSDCSYAAQPCMYTAQGEMICPKEGLGNCGSSLKYKN